MAKKIVWSELAQNDRKESCFIGKTGTNRIHTAESSMNFLILLLDLFLSFQKLVGPPGTVIHELKS